VPVDTAMERSMTRADSDGEPAAVARQLSSVAPYHAVRFYENDRSLAQIVAEFLREGLAEKHPALVVATAAHRAAILRELVTRQLDVVELQRAGDLVLLDAQGMLDTFMTNGKPDVARFMDVMCGAIEKTCRGRADCIVRVYGEMVDILWKQEQRDGAIRLEVLWNQLANSAAFSLLCGYSMGNFYKDAQFDEICHQHTHVIVEGGASGK
jgi:hypothetical protein